MVVVVVFGVLSCLLRHCFSLSSLHHHNHHHLYHYYHHCQLDSIIINIIINTTIIIIVIIIIFNTIIITTTIMVIVVVVIIVIFVYFSFLFFYFNLPGLHGLYSCLINNYSTIHSFSFIRSFSHWFILFVYLPFFTLRFFYILNRALCLCHIEFALPVAERSGPFKDGND